MRIFCILFIQLFVAHLCLGQSVHFSKSHPVYHIFDRLDIKHNVRTNIHTGVKRYNRKSIIQSLPTFSEPAFILNVHSIKNADFRPMDLAKWNMAKGSMSIISGQQVLEEGVHFKIDRGLGKLNFLDISMLSDPVEIYLEKDAVFQEGHSLLDQAQINYLKKDNIEWFDEPIRSTDKNGLLKHFYKSQANFLSLRKPNLDLFINPIINFRFGKEADSSDPIFQNTRGIEMKAVLDNKVYVYTSIFENQTKFYNYIEDLIGTQLAIPGQGFYKDYQSAVAESINGWDYLNADAYFGFSISKHMGIELGHTSHFIGHGYRSLLLSDYSNNYFYLKLQANIWKLHYQSIFSELAPLSTVLHPKDKLLDKKYMASHYLSYKPRNNIEFGVFETVIFSRANHFEFQYLNPVILYRTVEQFLDSPDNVIIGLNGKWNMFHSISLYGQLVIDEFKISELTAGTGWWANKYGLQLGLKYIDALGIDQMDVQAELNVVRPFTYSHKDTLDGFDDISIANYSHHGLPLAHPLGANFAEMVLKMRYVPHEKIILESKLLYAIQGENDEIENYGSNLLVPAQSRRRDYGFGLLEGVENKIITLAFDFSYMLRHNIYFDVNLLYRKADSENDLNDLTTQYFGAGFRMNVANYKIDY